MKIRMSWLHKHERRNRIPVKLYLSSDHAAWPEWIVRDLGLNDPENGMLRQGKAAQAKLDQRRNVFFTGLERL